MARIEGFANALDGRYGEYREGIVFLAANELPAVEGLGVAPTAILEIVQMIRDQMGVDARGTQELRVGVVEGLERPPGPVREIQPPGLHVPARGHAWQGPDIMGVERDRPSREPVEIRGRNRLAAIGAKRSPVQ